MTLARTIKRMFNLKGKRMSKSRIYEVPVLIVEIQKEKFYLVDATSQAAAWRHVADKYVGKPVLPDGKRIAELVGRGHKVESVKEE